MRAVMSSAVTTLELQPGSYSVAVTAPKPEQQSDVGLRLSIQLIVWGTSAAARQEEAHLSSLTGEGVVIT
jgi:hypothetical protein